MPGTVDIVLAILFLVIVIHAGLRGLTEELTGAAWLIGGTLFALAFFRQGAAFIRTKMLQNVAYVPEALAFILLFFIAFILIQIIGAMLKEIVERSGLKALDHVLGILFGIFKAVVLLAALVFLVRLQPLFDGNAFLQGSKIARLLSPGEVFIERTLDKKTQELRNV